MAVDFSRLRKSIDTNPPIITIYGGEGLGKSTFASEAPNPLYIQTGKNERPPTGAEMMTFGLCETFQDVIDQADWMMDSEANEDRLTFVVDTLDSLESLVHAEACARNNWKEVEEPGFGRGYVAVSAVWKEFIDKMVDLKQSGFVVILLAHALIKTDPGVTTDSYPRYRINIKRADDGNAVAHASDIVGFIHQRVSVKKEEAGFKKTNNRAEGGGERVIAIEERGGFVAKNRYGLTGTVPFKKGKGYAELAKHFPSPRGFVQEEVANEPDEQDDE